MKFDFVIIAVLASIANGQTYCADSEVRFNINGNKQKCTWDDLECTGNFDSDKYSSHCKATCNIIECCSDSLAKFKTPSDGYKDCVWVGKKSERCNDMELANTCPVSCKLCIQPTINELASKIDLLEIENTALRLRVDSIESSQTDFCVDLDNTHLCFPTVNRNGTPMIYVNNRRSEYWNYHNEMAITCGGYLADIRNEEEFEKAISFSSTTWIGYTGGEQDKVTCTDQGAADCWKWQDGSSITYFNWNDGEPNDYNSYDDTIGIYNGGMNDVPYIAWIGGLYVLPRDFFNKPGCDIVHWHW